jgi:putative FmdB family regulatory protein
MPTYNYECDACGFAFEREQRISENAIKKCPKCGKSKARRMISAGNFILKGGGWYSDGYGSSGASSDSKGSEGSSSSGGSSSSSSPSGGSSSSGSSSGSSGA